MAVHLVRHASAGTRHNADPHDDQRRLDDLGHRQAEAVAELLGDAPVSAIESSPARRCLETVAPLAARLAVPVHHCDGLFEGSDIETSWAVLAGAAALDGDVVLCSHGDVIPMLIRRLQLRGMELRGGSGCAKSSCWTLEHWDGERFASGRYLPPPLRG